MEGAIGDELAQRKQEITPGQEQAELQAAPTHAEETILAAHFRSHSGPLPSQEWLSAAEEIHPGATEIILRDFREERRHQREMQRKGIELDAAVVRDLGRYQHRRLLVAAALTFFLTACGLALILLDKALYGFVLLIAEITTLIGVLWTDRRDEESPQHVDSP